MNNKNNKNSNSQNLDKIYLQLASTPSLWDLKQDDFIRTLSKKLSVGLEVERVSVFVLEESNEFISQKNHYIASKDKHYSGLVFKVKHFPVFYEQIRQMRIWGESDALNSPRLKEFKNYYHFPFNITASLYCSIHNNGKLIGGVSVDHIDTKRTWKENEKRFLSSIADLIAQRLITTKALEEKEERYRAVFENSVDGMFLTRDGVCIDCNESAQKLFNCKREDILQKRTKDFSPAIQPSGETSKSFAEKVISAAMRGEKQSFEYTYQRSDNSTFPAEVKLTQVDIMGLPYLLTTIQDISQKKLSQNKLALSNKKVKEQNKFLAVMNELSTSLQGADSVEDIYQRTLETLIKLPKSPKIAIYIVDQNEKVLRYHRGLGFTPEIEKNFSTLPFNENLDEFFTSTGQAIYFEDLTKENRFDNRIREKLVSKNIYSMIEVPFIVNSVRKSVLYLAYAEPHSVEPEILGLLFSISQSVSLALENTQTRSELAFMAHHDSLTGLGNRALFHQHFAESSFKNAALYLLDLDRFKEINDTLGHFSGDQILQQIGPRLSDLIHHHNHLVCRLGGDEFIVLVYDVNTDKMANDIAKAILECIRIPFMLDDLTLEIDGSLGIAMYPQDGQDSHELLRSADVAMYQAKHTRRGYALYQQHLDIHTPERLALMAELGKSIGSGQLILHYQPKLHLKTNKIIGFEALVRWNHPRLGLLGPNKFIPLIEMSNSIYQLTEEVLHLALDKQQQWRNQGLAYTVAVNLSAQNLIDDRIITLLEELLKTYNTPKNMLELEITETALIQDTYRASNYLKQISKLGIQISIDDFGTGYSSLAYIHKLPVNKLKLDREFTLGMLNSEQGTHIVKTIISLSEALNLDVVAEGVEDKETLDKLRELNCHQAQGYYICRPNSWENIANWLAENF